jgi:sensor histidine kinase YesM
LRHMNTCDADPGQERGKHIGLYNIRERLTYLYQNEDCMKIESNGGTTVSMYITPMA